MSELSKRRSRWDLDEGDRDRASSASHDKMNAGHRDNRRRYEDHRLRDDDEASSSRQRRTERTDRGIGTDQLSSRKRRDSYRSKRRSRSPDFARDRALEREAYDRKYGSADVATVEDKVGDEPDFEPSGLLAKESNSKNGVTLKYFEPPEARKPKKKWRLYVFEGGKEVDMFHVSRQSCYLIGRDAAVTDIPIDHLSVSKQHCVIQFRSQTDRNEFGDEKRTVKPFLIDLESANGSFVNKIEVPPSRYYELRNGDSISLGGSEREYVILMED